MQRVRFVKQEPMKLTIHNFAKIESAELHLDGMTVICGDNNTGKSTVGKVLAMLFEVFADQEKKVFESRKQKYNSILLYRLRNPRLDLNYLEEKKFAERITDGSLSGDELIAFLRKMLTDNDELELVHSVVKKIMEVRAIPDSELKRQIAHNCFEDVFFLQHLPLGGNYTGDTELILNCHGSTIKMTFQRDAVELPVLENDIDVHHHAFFIDSTDVLDYVNGYGLMAPHHSGLNRVVIETINSKIENGRKNENAIDDYLVNAKIKDIYEKLTTTLDGDFVLESGRMVFHEDNMPANLEITNLSKGMKAFALLQLLLKEHVLQQEDVLILDEPEIHLHPAWQVLYAEILVLLQRSFNLTVLLTTHSSYFLEAIQLYSRKYHQEKKLHIYQSSVQSNKASIKELDSKATDIYASFLMPLDTLQELRNELKEAERDE